ncbi:MAG: phasin family protein, partial [Aeromonas veronii]
NTWGRLEQVFEDRVARAVASLGIPTRKDIDKLSKRMAELTDVVQQLLDAQEEEAPAAEAKPAAAKKPAARKPPVKKAPVAKAKEAVVEQAADLLSAAEDAVKEVKAKAESVLP